MRRDLQLSGDKERRRLHLHRNRRRAVTGTTLTMKFPRAREVSAPIQSQNNRREGAVIPKPILKKSGFQKEVTGSHVEKGMPVTRTVYCRSCRVVRLPSRLLQSHPRIPPATQVQHHRRVRLAGNLHVKSFTERTQFGEFFLRFPRMWCPGE